MSLKNQATKGAAWSLLQSWSARLWGMLVFFLLARLLGPEDFGLVAYAGVFIAIADVFLGHGFVGALVQRRNLEPEHLNTAFLSNVATGALLTTIVLVVAPWLAQATSQPELTAILRWLSLSFIIGSFANVQDAILQRGFAYKKLMTRTLTGLVIGGVVGVAMAFSGFGVWSLVAQQLTTVTLSTLVLWLQSSWKPQWSFSRKHFSDLFIFERSSFGTRCLNLINRRSDDFLIGFFLGPVTLGLYSLAYRFYLIVADLFASAISPVAFSTIARTQEDVGQSRKAFYTIIEMASLFAFPAFVGLAFVAPILIPLLSGEGWDRSIPVLQILCGVGVIQAITRFNFVVVQAYGKPQWEFKFNILAAFLNLVFFFIVVRFGIKAVALSYTLHSYVLAPISVAMVRRLIGIGIRDYVKCFAGPLIASSCMAGVLGVVIAITESASPLLRLTFVMGLGSCSYLIFIWFLSPKLLTKLSGSINSMLPKRLQRISS